MLPICQVAGKQTIQENEELDGFTFLVVSVQEQTTTEILIHLWEYSLINLWEDKIYFISAGLNKESLDDILSSLKMTFKNKHDTVLGF